MKLESVASEFKGASRDDLVAALFAARLTGFTRPKNSYGTRYRRNIVVCRSCHAYSLLSSNGTKPTQQTRRGRGNN